MGSTGKKKIILRMTHIIGTGIAKSCSDWLRAGRSGYPAGGEII